MYVGNTSSMPIAVYENKQKKHIINNSRKMKHIHLRSVKYLNQLWFISLEGKDD